MWKKIQRALQTEVAGSNFRLWPLAAMVLPAFAWIQPHHYPPWSGFHESAGMAAYFLLVLWVLLTLKYRPTEWAWPPIVISGVFGIVWLQWAVGMIPHMGQALLFSGNLLCCILIWLGVRSVYQRDTYIVGDVLFSALAFGGVINTIAALFQWLNLASTDVVAFTSIWVVQLPEQARPAGNVAQPNEMATLLMWAMTAGLWAYARGRLSALFFAAYGLLLAIGLALTHSRIGLIQSTLVLICLVLFHKRLGGRQIALAYLIIWLLHIGLFFGMEDLTRWLYLEYRGRAMDHVTQDMGRRSIYEMAIAAIQLKPWLGWGATQFAEAQWALAQSHKPLGAYYAQAHNWILDLLLWFGVPIGVSIGALVLFWCIHIIRKIKKVDHIVMGIALLIFGLHATVELVHWSSIYLLTATAFAAYLCAATGSRVIANSSKLLVGFLLSIATMFCVIVIIEYVNLERNFVQYRAEKLKVRNDISEVPDVLVLTHLADMLRISRLNAHPGYSDADLQWMEASIKAAPFYHNQFTHAASLALNGKRQEAELWMRRLDSCSPPAYRRGYRAIWKNYQAWYPKQVGQMEWPDVPP
jgi:O-antigen ligase